MHLSNITLPLVASINSRHVCKPMLEFKLQLAPAKRKEIKIEQAKA
jgi:hypothetical protein